MGIERQQFAKVKNFEATSVYLSPEKCSRFI